MVEQQEQYHLQEEEEDKIIVGVKTRYLNHLFYLGDIMMYVITIASILPFLENILNKRNLTRKFNLVEYENTLLNIITHTIATELNELYSNEVYYDKPHNIENLIGSDINYLREFFYIHLPKLNVGKVYLSILLTEYEVYFYLKDRNERTNSNT